MVRTIRLHTIYSVDRILSSVANLEFRPPIMMIVTLTLESATLDGQRVYYNHIRPHQGLNGKTPAQAAGLELDLGTNKWESLIKKASREE
jgi:hypothetical protein